MFKFYNFEEFFVHFRQCTSILKKTYPFIKKKKLWEGFFDNKWILFTSVFISLLFSYFLYHDTIRIIGLVGEWFDGTNGHGGETISEMKSESKIEAISSGTRFLMLVFLEIVIFHFCVKAVNILTNGNDKPTLAQFIKAEKRMIIIMGFSFIKWTVAHFIINTLLHMIGMGWSTRILMIFVYGYFIGYAFFDNYNEQFHKTLKESALIIKQHVGAVTALGVVVSILLYVPLLGPVFAPIFGGIAAALYGHKYHIEETIILEETT